MDTYLVISWHDGEAIFEYYSPSQFLDAENDYRACLVNFDKSAMLRVSPDLYSFLEYSA